MLFKRVVALLGLAFGFLGAVACLAGVYAVWLLGSNLQQANDKVFAALDTGLSSAQDRIRSGQKRVQDAKITSNEIGQKLRDSSLVKAKERFVSQLEIESRAEKLAGHFQTADIGLETSVESIRGAQQVLTLGNLFGAPVDAASLDDVLEKLKEARSWIQQAERSVEEVRKFAAVKDGESAENRVSRAVKLLARTPVTIGEIDNRLEASAILLSELLTSAGQIKARSSNYIFLTTLGGYLFLVWIAAGQVALCLCGWRRQRQSRYLADR